jgi:hypothetical protein
MPEKVTILKDLNIIKIDSFGEVSLEDLKQSLETVFKIHREQGLTKVFVDATKETSLPSTFPVFEFGSELAKIVRNLKFAVVTSPKMKDIMKFLETVTQNRGVEVQMFDSEDAALEWLMMEP